MWEYIKSIDGGLAYVAFVILSLAAERTVYALTGALMFTDKLRVVFNDVW